MKLTLEQAITQKLMWTFRGLEPTPEILALIKEQFVGGLTIFRYLNVDNAAQVRALTAALQQAAAEAGQPPLLIAADQEGGQLMAIENGPTHFPGNLALGAAGSLELARQTGLAMGRELAAMGININYAPACDVNSNPQNPVIGTRSFGEDPVLVGRLAAAMVEGLQAAGVAATAKHFPGHGDTASDSHHSTPVLWHSEERLRSVEWPPFAEAIAAGVRLVMTGHIALPKVDNGSTIPATLSPRLVRTMLRDELGFTGVIISDAMVMGAIEQGPGLIVDTIAAAAAGVDLLLLDGDLSTQKNVYTGLLQATQRGLLTQADMVASAQRVLELRKWLAQTPQPSLEVVGCAEHHALAGQIAAQSITLVRDEAHVIPLRLGAEARLAVIMPQPVDLTPADTSSLVDCALARVMRRHAQVTEFKVAHHPSPAEIAALRQQVLDYDVVIVGTINAYAQAEQPALVNELLMTGIPVIVVALRMPYDLQAFPAAPTYLCSYNILEPSMEALAQVLWGEIPPLGRLPVSIPGLYPLGHRLYYRE